MKKWGTTALVLSIVCGFGFAAAALSSDGWDFRPEGGDVTSILTDRTRTIESRRTAIAKLQEEIEELSERSSSTTLQAENTRIAEYVDAAGLTEVTGGGIRVVLTDAPRGVDVPGLDPNLLVVHQQDIQAVVNALWRGGAEAITLQGQRIVSTTGIKCVGNTVLLNGIPYSPPYVVEAIGSTWELNGALNASPEVVTYASYAERYGLGFERSNLAEITAPAYAGSVLTQHATVAHS